MLRNINRFRLNSHTIIKVNIIRNKRTSLNSTEEWLRKICNLRKKEDYFLLRIKNNRCTRKGICKIFLS